MTVSFAEDQIPNLHTKTFALESKPSDHVSFSIRGCKLGGSAGFEFNKLDHEVLSLSWVGNKVAGSNELSRKWVVPYFFQ
jgi:hypothetical protein